MRAKRIDYTNRRTHSTQDTTTNKRSRWICNQCKRQYCGAKPCPFCYRIEQGMAAAAQPGGDRPGCRRQRNRSAASQRITGPLPDRKVVTELTPP